MTGEQIRWLALAAVGAVMLAGGIWFGIRRQYRNIAWTVLLCSALALFLALSDIYSVAEYTDSSLPPVRDGDAYVWLTVDATDALPDNGLFLPEQKVRLSEGDTVLSVLRRVARATGLSLETQGGYVEGIGSLYEFDRGGESGWTFFVNRERPGVSAATYRPESGDRIVWKYVLTYRQEGSS